MTENQNMTPEDILRKYVDPAQGEQWAYFYPVLGAITAGVEAGKRERDKWLSVEEELPPIDEYVLIYYTIKSSMEENIIHEYTEIARIQSITDYGASKSIEWIDRQYNGVDPTHWQPLPSPPNPDKGGKEK